MTELESFFNKRKKEIEQYFHLLEYLKVDNNSSYTIAAYGNNMEEEEVFALEISQIQTLKSSCFLLLYNSIEGTINQSLEYIIDKINDDDDNLTHKKVINEIQEIWLKHSLEENGNIYEINLDMVTHIETYIEQKIDINLKIFKEKNKAYFSSGNLNDNKIHNELFPKIGLITDKIIESKLDEIKEFRNQLAHGGSSFNDIGSRITLVELNVYKDKSFRYLEKYIKIIEDYIEHKKFKIN